MAHSRARDLSPRGRTPRPHLAQARRADVLTILKGLVPPSLKERSLKRNVALNWVVTLIGVALGLFLTPLTVASLKQEQYGVWSFINGLTLYSNLLYVGLGAAFMKRMSEAVGRRDVAGQTRLLSVAGSLYTGIGLLCFALALALSPVVPRLLASPLSPDAQTAATITMALLGVRLLFMFVNSAFSALLASHGRADLVSVAIIIAALIRSGGVLWATSQKQPMIWLSVVAMVDGFIQLPLFVGFCRLVAPEVRARPVKPTRDELRGLYGFGAQAFVVQTALLIIGYTDTALIGVLLGASSVALYTLPLQLVEQSRVLVNGITQSLLPELAAYMARGELEKVKQLFLGASRVCASLSVLVNVHLVLLGPAFLTLWVGPAVAAESPRILLFLSIAATASALSTQVMNPFYQALDLLKLLVLVVLAEAVVNFALSVWFAGVFGVWGVALATAVPAVAITMVFAPRVLLPRIGVTVGEFTREVVFPAVVLGLTCAATQQVLSLWLASDTLALLLVRAACSGLAVLLVAPLVFPRGDWLPILTRLAPPLARRLQP